MSLLDDAGLAALTAAYASYDSAASPFYDEVLAQVTSSAAEGSLGKYDIGALVLWKRLRADTKWATALMSTPDADVRAATAEAVKAVRDVGFSVPEAARRGRSALLSLPGCRYGDALASAVLVAAGPDRMAVYDSRAHSALTDLGIPLDNKQGRYGRYMELVEQLRVEVRAGTRLDWTARQVDLALYSLGGSRRSSTP